MKYCLFLLCLCGFLPVFADPELKKVSIEITDCRDTSDHYPHVTDTLLFYRLPERVLAKKVPGGFIRDVEVALVAGSYEVMFSNKYGQPVKKRFTLKASSYHLILCIDSLQAYPDNTFERMMAANPLVIQYYSSGCFHAYARTLIIASIQGRVHAALFATEIKDREKDSLFNILTRPLLAYKALTRKDITWLTRFENELRNLPEQLCTSRDHYDIQCGLFRQKKVDGTCDWYGFKWLCQAWFGPLKGDY